MSNKLEVKIGYTFNNKQLLEKALTHSSFANEHSNHLNSNERLEFLGDSVLSLVVSEFIYGKFNNYPEGKLTKLRASLVCEKALSNFARKIDLGHYLMLGHGELKNHGDQRDSILSDAFEALIAAIYLDSDFNMARDFVLSFVIEALNNNIFENQNDYKSKLQEIIQKNPQDRLSYQLVGESGPDHEKRFIVEVRINNNIVGKGVGNTIKEAEQISAKHALELMGINEN